MISTISSREPRRKEKKEEWKICSLLLEFLPFHWLLCPRKKSWHPIHPPRHPLSRTSSLSLLIHLQLAISRRRHGIRQCSHDAKCNSNAVSVPVLRASGCGQRSGAEVVANCGTDPRTRPAGNGEELSRMDESSPRVGRFPWLGWADGPRQGKASVGYSCPRVVHDRVHVDPRAKRRFRGSRPRKPPINRPLARPRRWNSSANEFVGSAGGINTGQSHRRKWPYNLSPSGRGAINRAALSANELLLSPFPPPPERESWKSTRKIGVASG